MEKLLMFKTKSENARQLRRVYVKRQIFSFSFLEIH